MIMNLNTKNNYYLYLAINFYESINKEWGRIVKNKIHNNFIYHELIKEEENGIYENGGILIHKSNTIKDTFVIIHELAHYIDRVYNLTHTKLNKEYLPLLLEYKFYIKNNTNNKIEKYYKERELIILNKDSNYKYAILCIKKGLQNKL